MSLVIPRPFDHAEWVFELKHDGFRALAYVDGHRCRLVSRRGHVFTKFGILEDGDLPQHPRLMRSSTVKSFASGRMAVRGSTT